MTSIHTRLRPARGRRGSALVFTLVMLCALMMLGSAYVHMALSEARRAGAALDQSRSFQLAEAGLAEAMTALRAGSAGLGNVGSVAQPAALGGGLLWVVSTAQGANTYRLVSTGMVGGGRAAVEAVVELESESPLFVGVLNSKEALTLNSGVIIDSYASAAGSYALQAVNLSGGILYAKPGGDVSSNQSVLLNANAHVFGDATPGVGCTVTFGTGATVTGSTAPMAVPMDFPKIDVPSVASTGPLTLGAGAVKNLPAGTYGYDNINLGKASQLTLTGPSTVVVKDFLTGPLSRLNIDATAGPVTIYVQGNFVPGSKFEVMPVLGSPAAVAFMIEGTNTITFPNDSQVRGAYYAPNANVVFTNTNQVWGAIAANRIDMSSATRFHYDESLADYWTKDSGDDDDPLQLLSWRRGAVPPQAGAGDHRDPFQTLGVNQAKLSAPAASW